MKKMTDEETQLWQQSVENRLRSMAEQINTQSRLIEEVIEKTETMQGFSDQLRVSIDIHSRQIELMHCMLKQGSPDPEVRENALKRSKELIEQGQVERGEVLKA